MKLLWEWQFVRLIATPLVTGKCCFEFDCLFIQTKALDIIFFVQSKAVDAGICESRSDEI